MDSTTTNNGEGDPPPSATTSPPQLIVHLLEVNEDYATYFHASSPSFFACPSPDIIAPFEPGKLYCLQASVDRDAALFSELPERARRAYTHRQEFAFTTELEYRRIVIGGLMLERRLVDYAQSCAIVTSMTPTLVISVPKRGRRFAARRAIFATKAGEAIDVSIEAVSTGSRRIFLTCSPLLHPLPAGLDKGARLVYSDEHYPSIVTRALEGAYRGHEPPIGGLDVLDRIYGAPASFYHARVDRTLVNIPYTNIVLNGELSAVVRSCSSSEPAIVVENLQEDEATLTWLQTTLASLGGKPLFAAKNNDVLLDFAADMYDADECTSMRILHAISAEKEAHLDEGRQSPYSIFTSWRESANPHVACFNELREQFQRAGKRKKRALIASLQRAWTEAWKEHPPQEYDAVLGTLGLVLGYLTNAGPGPVREFLNRQVDRIVVLDTHNWCEADLVALVANFKNPSHQLRRLQFVFIGDATKKPPYFNRHGLPSELTTHSAMSVLKRHMNIPVLKIRQSFTPPPPPPVIRSRSLYADLDPPFARAMLMKVARGVLPPRSSDNGEVEERASPKTTLEIVLKALTESGEEQQSGTIIASEASFRAVQASTNAIVFDLLKLDFPGRESDSIIKLWTTDARGAPVENHAFFAYPYEPSDAVRRHKEATELLERSDMSIHRPEDGVLAVVRHNLGVPGRSDRAHADPTRRVAV